MSRTETPSFILELPLRTKSSDEGTILKRLEAGRQLYNACLGESLKRMNLMQESKAYRKLLSMPAGKERSQGFKKLRERYKFKDSSIQSYAVKIKNSCHIKDHLDVHTVQKVATRAFNAVNEYILGRRGKPRFKGKNQFDSLESKTNANGIRYRSGYVLWKGLKIPCLIDEEDPVVRHGLSCPVKYNRIVRRKIKGKNRFCVQLILEGRSYQKPENKIAKNRVSLDIGPSTAAYFSGDHAELEEFCSELKGMDRIIRLIQRAMDRSRRASNPDNYNDDGTVKKGSLKWSFSKRYLRLKGKLAELFRKQAAYRKSLHGRLANEILSHGKYINVETQSYKAFQMRYGRSVGFRAPGKFILMLSRKAESANGWLNELPTKKLRLSQKCHCGREKKKPLSQRWHICGCGVVAQRDLYSAYLGWFVKRDTLDTLSASQYWEGAEPLLKQAVSRVIESANGRHLPSSFGIYQMPPVYRRQSGSPVNSCGDLDEARDVVAIKGESPGESVVNA